MFVREGEVLLEAVGREEVQQMKQLLQVVL